MMKLQLPFSTFDFFGYLAGGFILLTAWHLFVAPLVASVEEPKALVLVLWAIVAYVLGHVLSSVSSWLVNHLVMSVIPRPATALFAADKDRSWLNPLATYLRPLPSVIQSKILTAAGMETAGNALFHEAYGRAYLDEQITDRVNIFSERYQFCRQISVAFLLASLIVLIGSTVNKEYGKLYWLFATLPAAYFMFLRFLYFYRHYNRVLFTTVFLPKHDAGAEPAQTPAATVLDGAQKVAVVVLPEAALEELIAKHGAASAPSARQPLASPDFGEDGADEEKTDV